MKKPHDFNLKEIFQSQQETSIDWRTQSVATRIGRLLKMKDWVNSHKDDIRQAIYADFKKPPEEVDLSEIYVVLSEIKHILKNLERWCKPLKAEAPLALVGSRSYVYYEPKGVCLIIAPWNFPFNLSIAPLASALAAGNTVILKPSELTPNCTRLIETMVQDLFLPSEVAVISGGKEIAQELLKLPFDHIFFTGSPAVGKIVMAAAAENLTSVTLELGGKSPTIIDESADLQDAAEKIAWGKFINCGQTCIAPDYILIHHSVQNQFTDELRLAVDKLFNEEGLGIENSPSYARIINNSHFQRLNGLLTNAIELGANLEIGGATDDNERYLAPTALSKIPENARIMHEEIFGPILPLISYQTLDEAIHYVNSNPKPLALYIFSKSGNSTRKILESTSSGSAAVNDCVIQFMNPHLPFGGVNASGFGKSHGHHGFLSFSNEKSVVKQKTGLTSIKPVYPPYTSLAKNAINILLKYF